MSRQDREKEDRKRQDRERQDRERQDRQRKIETSTTRPGTKRMALNGSLVLLKSRTSKKLQSHFSPHGTCILKDTTRVTMSDLEFQILELRCRIPNFKY